MAVGSVNCIHCILTMIGPLIRARVSESPSVSDKQCQCRGSVTYRAIIGEVSQVVHFQIHLRIGILYMLVKRCIQSLHHFDGTDLLDLFCHSIQFASFECLARKNIRSLSEEFFIRVIRLSFYVVPKSVEPIAIRGHKGVPL